VFDRDALTIGFARRFATYKRATLLLSQPDRLRALLASTERPVQFVFAGKAHPADEPGKQMIQAIHRFSHDLGIARHFVFVPDYDMALARSLYHGADVWLNTPRRPLEACGTSGMKAALNGALNCSIRDGWWDEWYHPANGWAIPTTDDADVGLRDQREATALFEILERSVVPTFFDRDGRGVPVSWLDRIRAGWVHLGPRVTASRMVKEYVTRLYEPAATRAAAVTGEGGRLAAELTAYGERVRHAWPDVRVGQPVQGEPDPTGGRRVTVDVALGGLAPGEVAVELVHGPIDEAGTITAPTVVAMDPPEGSGSSWSRVYRPGRTGRYGATVRVRPSHPALATPMHLGLLRLAEGSA
jgi:starch phosphorylase